MKDTKMAHCYSNPTFCRQEYIGGNVSNDELPPPPQFQATDELPPPSPSPPPPPPPVPRPQQQQQQQQQQIELENRGHYNSGHVNAAYVAAVRSERINVPRTTTTPDRYAYLDETRRAVIQRPQEIHPSRSTERRAIIEDRDIRSRYEYIVDDEDDDDVGTEEDKLMPNENNRARTPDDLPRRTGSSRYAFIDNPADPRAAQVTSAQKAQPRSDNLPGVFAYQRRENSRNGEARYALVPVNSVNDDQTRDDGCWTGSARNVPTTLVLGQRATSMRGRYARVPNLEQVSDPPQLPDRNMLDMQIIDGGDEVTGCVSPKNNIATQKLHEILTTPRKPRSRSEERTLSPSKRQHIINGFGQRGAMTPTGSPSGRFASSPSRGATTATPRRDQIQLVQSTTPRRGDLSPNVGPHTSTPNKEPPSARRCLPLNLDNSTSSRGRETRDVTCPASNCGRLRYPPRAQGNSSSYGIVGSPSEPLPHYAYLDGLPESIPMVVGSPRYQVVAAGVADEKSVESAFIARTAVVPPLSPPNSEANTTLASAIEKNDRRNAPLLLLLVGVLTCGLALYLSWSQGRRYYLDSAAGCGACCALAGACRSLRRTWTGLGLAGLSALSCAGLLLIAAKAPRPGTPLHDVTAGALCGVSLLGASLALLALVSPKCSLARHRRVHSWMPRFYA